MSLQATIWVWDQRIGPTDKLVLLRLADQAGKDSHQCWPGAKGVAEATGLSVKSVRRALLTLQRTGLIHVQPQKHPSGRSLSSLYTLAVCDVAAEAGAPARAVRKSPPGSHGVHREVVRKSRGAGHPVHRVGGHSDHQIYKENLPYEPAAEGFVVRPASRGDSIREPTARTGVEDVAELPGFEAFWGIYPKRIGKLAAETEYASALKRTTPGDIMAGLARYKPDPKYVPAPAKWLRDGRWMDEVPATAAARPAQAPRRAGSISKEEAARLGL